MQNLGGPAQSTVDPWLEQVRHTQFVDLCQENFRYIAKVYAHAKLRIGLEHRVIVMAAKDETSIIIIDELGWDIKPDQNVGSCGF